MTHPHRQVRPIFQELLLILCALLAIAPFAYLLVGSVRDESDLSFSWDNYRRILRTPLASWMMNSLLLASTQTVLVILTSSLAGFALAKYQFKGRVVIAGALAIAVLVPSQVLFPGMYAEVRRLGLIDSYLGVIAPSLVSVFGIFLFKASFETLNDDVLSAARLDGASEITIWWCIALPAIRPTIHAFMLMSFLSAWNAFLWPQIVLQSDSRLTLPLGLVNLQGISDGPGETGRLLAATVIGILPCAVLFILLERDTAAGLMIEDGSEAPARM